MSSDLVRKAQKFKERAERNRQQADKAQGALDSLLDQLKKAHGLKSLEEAEALIPKLARQVQQVRDEVEKMLKEYEIKYPDV